MHRGCLSMLCRRLHVDPPQFWAALYSTDRYRSISSDSGLFYGVDYFDMEGRAQQSFEFTLMGETMVDGEPLWYEDPKSMEDLKWLFARPNVFPKVEPLTYSGGPPPDMARTACMKMFANPELLNNILAGIVHVEQSHVAAELEQSSAWVSPCVVSSTSSIFSLLQVSRFFHRAIVRDRQGLFLRLAHLHGWMLPVSPLEWAPASWPNASPIDLALQQPYDWRAYLLAFLRKENPHVRNRWRFHRMQIQFARLGSGTSKRKWLVGELGHRQSPEPPKAWEWELERRPGCSY
jgi:hypothetical protein